MYSRKILTKFLGVAVFVIALACHQFAFGKFSHPGIWNAGGTVVTMLIPEDTLTFKKVQMQEERIYIQLYKGYAVVKGAYQFRNTTGEVLKFKMGYPVSGIYYGGDADLNAVRFDTLSSFRVKSKGEWLQLRKEPIPEGNPSYERPVSFCDNRMVWEMIFAPEESRSVEVYFIVNTNEASVQRGYNSEQRNAFIYLLESGSMWHQPIEKGCFYVQLKDGLPLKSITGISQGFGFMYNETNRIFAAAKTRFSPTPKDNLVITYHEYHTDFAFNKVSIQAEELFSKIDGFSQLPLESLMYAAIETGDPYAVENTVLAYLPVLLTVFVIFAPVIIGVLVVAMAIWAINKWVKLKRSKNKAG